MRRNGHSVTLASPGTAHFSLVQLGVLLIEPQWGSSVAAMPWPPALLKAYIAEAKSRGIAVVADEIMCGLGRHGAKPAEGGTGCFLSECWDLQPDVVTFGKSIGGGAGHLLSGAVLLHSANKLEVTSKTALQSHTVRTKARACVTARESTQAPFSPLCPLRP